MKKWFVILLAGGVLAACNNGGESTDDSNNDSDTTAMHEGHDHDHDHDHEGEEPTGTGMFGAEIDDEDAQPVSELLTMMGDQEELEVKLVGDVDAVCQAKGCWMTMNLANGEDMMIKFKDYEFFVPKDCAGKEAVVAGVARRTTVTVEELRHYAQDAGKSEEEIMAITEPEESIEFVADGVIIRNKG